MITRKEYMAGKFTHREYYGQFVTDAIKTLVRNHIGEQVIKRSEDPHLNDIPLRRWDNLHQAILSICGKAIASTTTGGIRLSDTVCIAKEAAKQIQIGRAVFPAPKIKGDEPMCDTPFYKWLEENKVDKFVDAIKQHLTPLGFDIKTHILEEEVLNSYKCVYEHFWWSYYHKGDKKS